MEAKYVLKYLKKTMNLALYFGPTEDSLHSFVDTD